jgi:hypothetical protein
MSTGRLIQVLWVAVACLATVSGCCHSSEEIATVARTPDNREDPCDEVCAGLIDPSAGDRDYEIVGCDEGLGEDGDPAVFCRVEVTYCESELH